MIKTIEANTPELRSLVEHTRRGDEIVITLDGKVESRVTAAPKERPSVGHAEMEAMAREFEARLYKGFTGVRGTPSQQIFDELREERL